MPGDHDVAPRESGLTPSAGACNPPMRGTQDQVELVKLASGPDDDELP
jgi:hypothetical protein